MDTDEQERETAITVCYYRASNTVVAQVFRQETTTMIHADYFVITFEKNNTTEAHLPRLFGLYVHNGREARMMNFVGLRGSNNVFVGESHNRIMIWASGSQAHYVATTIPTDRLGSYSVARIDLQVTITVLDADFMIDAIQPSKVYKASKIINIGEKGTTLYIGAPTSDLRFRIYNKSAESGIFPDVGGEFARFELQCRNRYADKAFVALRNKMVRAFYLMITKRMIDAYNHKILEGAIREYDEELFVDTFPTGKDDSLSRRKRWLEHSVFPAMKRLLLEDREYLDNFIDRLYNQDNSDDETYKY